MSEDHSRNHTTLPPIGRCSVCGMEICYGEGYVIDKDCQRRHTGCMRAMPNAPQTTDGEPEDFFAYVDDWPKCPTCKGAGTVNPLTAPAGFFCVSTTECPMCEGSGDCP